MALLSWSKAPLPKIEKNLPIDKRIYFISDLHLGDGTRSDIFMAKDIELMNLIEQVRMENAHLVIAGDAIDFQQAWTFTRIIGAHARLMRNLSELAGDTGVSYIWGNHDYDISLFRDVLHFDVCSTLTIGDKIKVVHGYEYDPFIGENLQKTHVSTMMHHLVERLLDTWIRPPIENFYTREGRLALWCFHKLAHAIRTRDRIFDAMGLGRLKGKTAEYIQYWAMNQIADPSGIFEPIREELQDSPFDYIVTGHSHLPGQVVFPNGKRYINTGSWTFNSSQYAIWDGESFKVLDWETGKEYTDQAYKYLIDRRYRHMDIFSWWRENYMGWLRYRVGENGRIRQPQNWNEQNAS